MKTLEQLIENQPCQDCKKKKVLCTGAHAANSGGGSDFSEEASSGKSDPENNTTQETMALRSDQPSLAKFLLKNFDKATGILAIKLADLQIFSPEQKKKFMDDVLQTWKQFRLEHKLDHSSHDAEIKKDAQGNIISIKVLVPAELINAFINRLVTKNLLPSNDIQKDDIQEKQGAHIRPRQPNSLRFVPPGMA
jgi:hypothetical protein